jgi:ATP-dependent RNA helicase RhlE
MHFSRLGLSAPILKALQEQGYETPSPIQAKAIPAILQNNDVMAAAQTGTGKTAGFTLPILELLSKGEPVRTRQVRTLILTPTRELAAQVAQSVATYGKHINLRSAVVFGGVKINPQISALRHGVDILVATPGRLLDLYQQKSVYFDQLEILVLDEADRMLDMGFINDIKKIMALLPKQRQTLLFSATFSSQIRALAKSFMQTPIEISVSPANTTVDSVEQIVYTVDKKQKGALLTHLIWDGRWEQVLVFTKTKHGANRLAQLLESSGMDVVAIHGNKSQGARTRALKQFKEGSVRALVATDIAARGLDIELLPHVVNFDLPHVAEDYVHRIGRTGRAGATGQAISLVSADEAKQLADIERLIKKKIPRKVADGFEPNHSVPEARREHNSSPSRNAAKKPHVRYRDRNDRRELSEDPRDRRRSDSRKESLRDDRRPAKKNDRQPAKKNSRNTRFKSR